MKKYLLPLLVLVIIGGWVLTQKNNVATNRETATPYPAATPTPPVSLSAQVQIGDAELLFTDLKEGETALVLTQKVAKVETRGEGENAFVISINGVKANEKKKEFWAFYINSKQAEVGAGTYKVKNGDTIGWKLETY